MATDHGLSQPASRGRGRGLGSVVQTMASAYPRHASRGGGRGGGAVESVRLQAMFRSDPCLILPLTSLTHSHPRQPYSSSPTTALLTPPHISMMRASSCSNCLPPSLTLLKLTHPYSSPSNRFTPTHISMMRASSCSNCVLVGATLGGSGSVTITSPSGVMLNSVLALRGLRPTGRTSTRLSSATTLLRGQMSTPGAMFTPTLRMRALERGGKGESRV